MAERVKLLIVVVVAGVVVASCGGGASTTTTFAGPVQPGDPVVGAKVYTGVCAACHSRDLSGVDGLGKPLAPSDVVASLTEEALMQLLIDGRSAEHPDNDTGIDMPPRGGNPSLTDQDLADVAAYLKAQNEG